MEKINRLLYSILFTTILFTSANAEWKMIDTKNGTFLYDTKEGRIFKYENMDVFMSDNNKYNLSGMHSVNYYNPINREITESASEYFRNNTPKLFNK